MSGEEVLKTYYGYDSFRPGQEPVIDALMSGRDVLDIMPTGGGKSICYQVPALLMSGITLVISPLVSLMKDQVTALVNMGIKAAFLNSTLTYKQYCLALERARKGWYKLIYVAPERLSAPEFRNFALSADISMVAVDEAHCISQWGQDFRPAYLTIPDFIQMLPRRPVVGAFTATATPKVQDDIQRLLRLYTPLRQVSGFDRGNLYFEVRQPEEKPSELMSIVRAHTNECGIVYCSTRKNVETVCEMLQQSGLEATRYHAGLNVEERRQNQEDFLFGRAKIMVATNAFGMGIDKSDVRYVIHYNMPRDLESYYQEAGRAGRDGEPAACILLYNGQDVQIARFLIEQSEPPESIDSETAAQLKEQDMIRLQRMVSYCRTRQCLRQYILQYFGEKFPNYCGNCGNCVQDFQSIDISREARLILQCIENTEQRFGVNLIAAVLRGQNHDERVQQKIERYHLYRDSTYGSLSALSNRAIRDRIHYLIDNGYLEYTGGEYPILKFTAQGRQLMYGKAEICMKMPKKERRILRTADTVLTAQQKELLTRLQNTRGYFARKQGVPTFVVFTDRSLREMAVTMPRTREAFLSISGVGTKKEARYGESFLGVIRDFIREKNL